MVIYMMLKKINDSVLRKALWTILAKCRVPPTILGIMQAGVRVGSTVTNCFEI